MKRFAVRLIPSVLLFACVPLFAALLPSCAVGKSGPFTFANKTGVEVNVIIQQENTVEKKFTAGEDYVGEDYYTPTVTFVKGIDTEDNKKIRDNRYETTSTNGFDYSFEKVVGQEITITLSESSLKASFPTSDNWYLAEANGKLGDYSNETVKFSDLSSSQTKQLYTSSQPVFKIYDDKNADITASFFLNLGKIDGKLNLIISFPKE